MPHMIQAYQDAFNMLYTIEKTLPTSRWSGECRPFGILMGLWGSLRWRLFEEWRGEITPSPIVRMTVMTYIISLLITQR